MFRQTLARNARLFSTSVRVQKGPVEGAKETIRQADRTVSDQIVKGIEAGEQAAQKAKDVAGVGAKEAQQKGQEAAKQAQDAKENIKQAGKS